MPDFVEHAHRRARTVLRTQGLHLVFERRRRPMCSVCRARELTDRSQQARNVREALRFGHEHSEAKLFKACYVSRLVAALPGENEIRFQREDAFEINARRVPDPRDALCRCGIIAEVGDSDQLFAGASGERDLGQMGRQRDDALRGCSERDRPAPMVGDGLRLHRRGERYNRQRHDGAGRAQEAVQDAGRVTE